MYGEKFFFFSFDAYFLILFFLVNTKLSQPIFISESEPNLDMVLESLLKDYEIVSLYDTLRKHSINAGIVWDLEDEDLKEMGMNLGERKSYAKAKERKMEERNSRLLI